MSTTETILPLDDVALELHATRNLVLDLLATLRADGAPLGYVADVEGILRGCDQTRSRLPRLRDTYGLPSQL